MGSFLETYSDSNMPEILKCYSFSKSLPSQIANKKMCHVVTVKG